MNSLEPKFRIFLTWYICHFTWEEYMEYITKCRSHGFTCRKRVLAEFAQNSNNRNSFHVLLLFFVKSSLLLLLVVKHVQHLHCEICGRPFSPWNLKNYNWKKHIKKAQVLEITLEPTTNVWSLQRTFFLVFPSFHLERIENRKMFNVQDWGAHLEKFPKCWCDPRVSDTRWSVTTSLRRSFLAKSIHNSCQWICKTMYSP